VSRLIIAIVVGIVIASGRWPWWRTCCRPPPTATVTNASLYQYGTR